MIAQENGRFEDTLEHFALQPGDFALTLQSMQNFASTSQSVRNFALSPQLSDLILELCIDSCSGYEIFL